MEQKYDQEFLKNKFHRIELKLDDFKDTKEEVLSSSSYTQVPIAVFENATDVINVPVTTPELELNPIFESKVENSKLKRFSLKLKEKYQALKLKRLQKKNEAAKQDEVLSGTDPKQEIKRIVQGTFEADVKAIFKGFELSTDLISTKKDFEDHVSSFKLDLLLFNFIQEKLVSNNLDINISTINLKTIINSSTINNILSFDLKIAGNIWSGILVKVISKSLLEQVEGYSGNIKFTYSYNLHSKNEKFVLTIQHDVLASFDEEDENKIQEELIKDKTWIGFSLDDQNENIQSTRLLKIEKNKLLKEQERLAREKAKENKANKSEVQTIQAETKETITAPKLETSIVPPKQDSIKKEEEKVKE